MASSVLSLTIEQIRLIRRLTPNVTIIYDGDAAGIKASLRGIDSVLEEGLNVRVVSCPTARTPIPMRRRILPKKCWSISPGMKRILFISRQNYC